MCRIVSGRDEIQKLFLYEFRDLCLILEVCVNYEVHQTDRIAVLKVSKSCNFFYMTYQLDMKKILKGTIVRLSGLSSYKLKYAIIRMCCTSCSVFH